MDPLKILKALSNPHRLDIILWLKHPEKEFGVQVHSKTLIDFPHSVSVKSIQKRCGVSQSSISTFMSILENAELVESRKIDQYTYFRRNEEVIREFGEWYNKEVSIQSDEIDKLLETVILEDNWQSKYVLRDRIMMKKVNKSPSLLTISREKRKEL